MLKRIMAWMGYILIDRMNTNGHLLIDIHDGSVVAGTLDIAVLSRLVRKNLPKHHIHKDPVKRQAAEEVTE